MKTEAPAALSLQPSRVSARLQQREAAAKQAQQQQDVKGGQSSSNGEGKNGKLGVSPKDITAVQGLIERCLQLYMPQREVVETLQAQAKVEPGFTNLVWQKLEEQNKEFFQAYHLRLQLKEHCVMFNHLLEQQQAMLAQLHASWVQAMPTLMTQSLPGMPSAATLPGASLPGTDTMSVDRGGMDSVLQGQQQQQDEAQPEASGGFPLPLCPLDITSLAGADDLVLIGDGHKKGHHGSTGSFSLLTKQFTSGVGGTTDAMDMMQMGCEASDDLIDGLVTRSTGVEGESIMMDGTNRPLGDARKFCSLSDLPAWSELEGAGVQGADVLDAGHSGGHDSSSPELMLGGDVLPDDSDLSLPGLQGDHDLGVDQHTGVDGAMGLLGVESDEVSGAFGNSGEDAAVGSLLRPYSMLELPGLDLSTFADDTH